MVIQNSEPYSTKEAIKNSIEVIYIFCENYCLDEVTCSETQLNYKEQKLLQ